MADKNYKITFEMTDGTEKSVLFVAPQGPQGEQGIQGETGPQGIQGIQGIQGEPGKDGENATPEQIAEAVENFMEENPFQGGEVTAESIEEALGYVPANPSDIPTKTSELTNDSGFITAEDIPEGGGAAIIDVPELPTEDINEEAFYRVPKFSVYYGQSYSSLIQAVYIVNGLPEIGEPVTTDMQNFVFYYNMKDGSLNGYVPNFIGSQFGLPEGWYPASLGFQLIGSAYGGIVYSEKEILNDDVYRFLLTYDIYSFKNVWRKEAGVGWAGTGKYSEIHNYIGNIASGDYSVAGGNNTQAIGDSSHAEGYRTTASGDSSHAEGDNTTASGSVSHAEGVSTTASGNYSHAEGYNTTASALYSHAEGDNTTASGNSSHAEGMYTVASSNSQHVQGEMNIEDTAGKYAHIVGNGSGSTRSNAHTLDWNGNAWFAGDVFLGGTSQDDAPLKVAEAISEAETTATNASNLVNKALDTTERAIAQAGEAKTTADEAKTLAETAKSKADEAHDTAVSTNHFLTGVEDLAIHADKNASEALSKATSALLEVREIEVPNVVQSAGQSTSSVMSQKAVVDYVNAALGNIDEDDYPKVDSIEEMTDTNKSYILKSTGTLWSWLPIETEVEVDKTEQIVSTADNPAKDGYALSTSGDSVNSTHVITPYIDLHKYGFPCTLHMNGLTWITETVDEATAIGKVRVQTYNENQEYILQYSSAKSGSGYWQYAGNYPDKVRIIDSTHQEVEFDSAYFINSSRSVRYLRFCTVGKWANADISVTYKGKEIELGEPQWVDTGVVVADITDFHMVNPDVKSYVDNVSYDDDNTDYSKSHVGTYAAYDYYRKDLPVPAVLKWDEDNMASEYVVAISTVAGVSKSTSVKYYTDTNKILLYNLIPNTIYYYKVHALCVNSTKKLVKEGSFTTGTDKTRMLNIDGIQNVRDIGGYTGMSGKGVKYGLIYRGSALDEDYARNLCITDKGKQELLGHVGVKTDLDLRYGYTESALGVDLVNTSSGFENYANVFKVPVQRTNFKNLFESTIAQLNANKPIYIHCQGGCDRTGTLVFLFLGLLGVSETDLAKEYELSSFSSMGFTRERNGEKYKGMISQLKNNYAGSTILDKLVTFATKANDTTETGGCGIDASKIDEFRNIMLVGGAPVVKYSITNTLTNCVNSNASTEADSGTSYSATISANSGYELSTVKVVMGGSDVTSTVYQNGVITIPNVTGNITITATATEMAKYTNLFNTSGSGFDDQSTKFFTNWIPYNSADNDGNGTIYHFKGFASTTTPYKVSFATDANGTGATSAIYGNALNRQSRTAASYNSKVNIVQHFIEGYSYVQFECREAVPANLIITANEDIVD